MDELVAWLTAQLDEDERKVAAMEREEHRVRTAPIFQRNPMDWLAGVDIFVSPTRWQAEIEAKRRILDWCKRMDPMPGMGGLLAGEARKIRLMLAQPYAGRPGWRAEWAT